MVRRPGSFWREQHGASLLEGLVVFPLVLLTFSAFVEFAYATYQWNQTVKALQLGARLAAVSDPIVTNYEATFTADYPTDQGSATPSPTGAPVSLVCNGATDAGCDVTRLNRLVARMQLFNDSIQKANVIVTYSRSGLGYVGRPGGPVSTIRIEVQNLQFNLPIMNALLGFNFTVPANPVTITSEDLSTTIGN